MKLPGDSDKQQAVSHEMMQRSLQSQRRVVKRVGLLEDKVAELEKVEERVDDIESAEIEPGTKLGDLADGAKKVAKGIGKSIGKNASLLADKAGKGLQKAGKSAVDAAGKGIKSAADATGKGIKDAASATGKGIKKGVKGAADATGKAVGDAAKGAKDAVGKGISKGTEKLTNVGKGLRDFIKDKAKNALKMPKMPDKLSPKAKSEGKEKDSTVSPKPEPQQNLVPDPVAAMGVDPKTGEYLSKEERIRQFKERRDMRDKGIDPDNLPEAKDIEKVDTLEEAGIGEDDTKKKVKKQLEDEFDVDPKMKKAFMEALALPAKSAAVAITDLLEKIPAPSKEASKILNRNISKISQQFKLGAASAEVANDEEDNDKKKDEGSGGSFLGTMLAKAFNLARGAMGGGAGQTGDGATGSQPMLPPGATGDPSYGRRAPFTGTADGIGMGDPKSGERAMQPIKKRTSLARKMFNMTPMGMAFNAASAGIKGAKAIGGKIMGAKDKIGGLAKKAFGMTPMGMGLKLGMKAFGGIKNIFAPKDEQKVNLTELTDKTIQENRENADAKTKKAVDTAAGTGAAVANMSQGGGAPVQSEGGGLAQPEIIESPYVDVYNTTSQF